MNSGAPDLIVHTEASPTVGHGHVARCMALAAEAVKRGLKVQFAVQDSYAAALVEAGGFQVCQGTAGFAPFIIRDFRSGSSPGAVREERISGSRVMLIDDHGEARTCATVVTDTFMTPQRAQRCAHASDVEYLYGLDYTPLRYQFLEAARQKIHSSESGSRLFVSFGGSDPSEITRRLLSALDECGFKGPATIVVDGTPEGRSAAMSVTASWQNTDIHQKVKDMAGLMKGADLVATKIGNTLLESYCLGAGCVFIEPTMAHVLLQAELANHYEPWPAMEYGLADEIDFMEAAQKTVELLASPSLLKEMGTQAARLVDGQGVIRLIDKLIGCDRNG